MSPEHAENLRRHMRKELQALEQVVEDVVVPPCADENELASRLSERTLDILLHERALRRAAVLHDALRRMNVDDYGICDACGEEIPALRLLADPAARLCVHCQQEAEDVDVVAGIRRVRTA